MLSPVNHGHHDYAKADRVACQPAGVSTSSRPCSSLTYSSTSRYVCDRTALRELLVRSSSTHSSPPVRVYSATAFVLVDGSSTSNVGTGSLTFVWSSGNRI